MSFMAHRPLVYFRYALNSRLTKIYTTLFRNLKREHEIFYTKQGFTNENEIISIFHGCMVRIEKSVTRVTDRHHEACRVMPNSDPE